MANSPFQTVDLITSAANAEVKAMRALHERKYRKKSGWFLAEGMRICREAVELGWNIHRLAFLAGRDSNAQLRPLLDGIVASGGRALPVTEALLKRISGKDNPQTLLGAFAQRWFNLNTITSKTDEIWLALDRVRDPGNLGTILRTVDAVGAKGVILVGESTDPYSVESVRASMGAVFNVKIIACSEDDFISFSHNWRGQIIGTVLSAPVSYRIADYNGPLIMMMGSERSGLTSALTDICDKLIKIPMRGRSDSLNLAVATGVVLYNAIEKRL